MTWEILTSTGTTTCSFVYGWPPDYPLTSQTCVEVSSYVLQDEFYDVVFNMLSITFFVFVFSWTVLSYLFKKM